MDVLEGLLYINEQDVYAVYGAFLCEDKKGEHTNYSALLKPPAMKPYTAVDFREQDGEKLPQTLTPAFEAREVTLQFALYATTKANFVQKYMSFVQLLKSGWLQIYLPELNKIYKMYYVSCTGYTQLTPLDAGTIAGRFAVKFREPVPDLSF
ncbi:hypothetical protein EZS27_024089 [termite gut metagenome]|uniref:Uncharacterized protein n=1 Tax=termite gut metagenome TaxID=433724 RepID=A0A5J4QY36_9ZZZZ